MNSPGCKAHGGRNGRRQKSVEGGRGFRSTVSGFGKLRRFDEERRTEEAMVRRWEGVEQYQDKVTGAKRRGTEQRHQPGIKKKINHSKFSYGQGKRRKLSIIWKRTCECSVQTKPKSRMTFVSNSSQLGQGRTKEKTPRLA